MMEFIDMVMKPQMLIMALAAVAAFATVLTVAMPILQQDRSSQRRKAMALERDKMRNARLSDMKGREAGGRLRPVQKGMMQDLVERFELKSLFDTDEARNQLKMAGLRGQGPLMAYIFFRLVMPPVMTLFTLFYLFVVMTHLTYPPMVKLLMSLGAGFVGTVRAPCRPYYPTPGRNSCNVQGGKGGNDLGQGTLQRIRGSNGLGHL